MIVGSDTVMSERDIDQLSFHLKHLNGLKIVGNYSAPGYLRVLILAIIMTPDIIFSVGDSYDESIHAHRIHNPGELEFMVHQNI